MPRKPKSDIPAKKSPTVLQPRKGESEDEWGGFVQANLTPMDKALFDQWYGEHVGHVNAYVDEHLASGLKLSVTFDGSNNAYIASYTGRPNTDSELAFRCTLSARSGEFIPAIALLVYKHVVICGGDWEPFLINGAQINNWG